jgi:adenylate cyclase
VMEIAAAGALRSFIEFCLGDSELGRRHFDEAIEAARALPPVGYAHAIAFLGVLTALGMYKSDDLVDHMRDALRRAESFGDLFGIAAAQWAYGTVLLRADNASHDEAISLLERAQTSIRRQKVLTLALATIGADLAKDATRKEKRDEAIDDLRALVSVHMGSGSLLVASFPAEALVELLIDRRAIGDLAEAHRIVDRWRARRLGIPALDLWWLKSRALLAEAEGNSDDHAELAREYLALCERLDARGRLAEARQMQRM